MIRIRKCLIASKSLKNNPSEALIIKIYNFLLHQNFWKGNWAFSLVVRILHVKFGDPSSNPKKRLFERILHAEFGDSDSK